MHPDRVRHCAIWFKTSFVLKFSRCWFTGGHLKTVHTSNTFSKVMHHCKPNWKYTPNNATDPRDLTSTCRLETYLLHWNQTPAWFSFLFLELCSRQRKWLHHMRSLHSYRSIHNLKKRKSSSMPWNYAKALSMVFWYPQGQPLANPPRGGYINSRACPLQRKCPFQFSFPPLYIMKGILPYRDITWVLRLKCWLEITVKLLMLHPGGYVARVSKTITVLTTWLCE